MSSLTNTSRFNDLIEILHTKVSNLLYTSLGEVTKFVPYNPHLKEKVFFAGEYSRVSEEFMSKSFYDFIILEISETELAMYIPYELFDLASILYFSINYLPILEFTNEPHEDIEEVYEILSFIFMFLCYPIDISKFEDISIEINLKTFLSLFLQKGSMTDFIKRFVTNYQKISGEFLSFVSNRYLRFSDSYYLSFKRHFVAFLQSSIFIDVLKDVVHISSKLDKIFFNLKTDLKVIENEEIAKKYKFNVPEFFVFELKSEAESERTTPIVLPNKSFIEETSKLLTQKLEKLKEKLLKAIDNKVNLFYDLVSCIIHSNPTATKSSSIHNLLSFAPLIYLVLEIYYTEIYNNPNAFLKEVTFRKDFKPVLHKPSGIRDVYKFIVENTAPMERLNYGPSLMSVPNLSSRTTQTNYSSKSPKVISFLRFLFYYSQGIRQTLTSSYSNFRSIYLRTYSHIFQSLEDLLILFGSGFVGKRNTVLISKERAFSFFKYIEPYLLNPNLIPKKEIRPSFTLNRRISRTDVIKYTYTSNYTYTYFDSLILEVSYREVIAEEYFLEAMLILSLLAFDIKGGK